MKRVLVIYRQRLGDIVGCLPAARLLAQAGHEVDFCCLPQYHSLFEALTYCRAVGPEALQQQKGYDHVYPLEITRSEYDAYRASHLPWRDYIYAKHPDLAPARDERPVFDRMPSLASYNLPGNYALAAPFGISQVTRVNLDWFRQKAETLSSGPWFTLTARPNQGIGLGQPLQARTLADLPPLIAGASFFFTINSAPNIIASGVRDSWHQVPEPGFGGQDNYTSSGQIPVPQPRELASLSWRFWVHDFRRRLMGIDTSADRGQ